MRSHSCNLLLAILLGIAGCASPGSRQVASTEPAPMPAEWPIDPKAEMTLDQIASQTNGVATVNSATTPASTQPSLDALEYYARGRASLANREPPYAAVALLEKAAQLDPDSAAVQYQLAQAYLAASLADKALRAYQAATALQPDWIDAQHEKARLQLRYSQSDALATLITATRTREYASNDGDAAAVDLDLAQLLRQLGYDRAAIEQYEKLLWRLSRRSLSVRGHPQVAALARRPEPVQLELARLYEKRGRLAAAISVYDKIAQTAPDAFAPQAQLVRLQLAAGQPQVARAQAGELVRRFRASEASIALFREAFKFNNPAGDALALAELQRLHAADPTDVNVTRALVELLAAQGLDRDAEALIAGAAVAGRPNVDLLRRLVRIGLAKGDSTAAARALIAATAAAPDVSVELAALWSPMVQSWRPSPVTPDMLAKLSLPESLDTARQYWLARVASETGRTSVMRSSLSKALAARPVFVPAWILRAEQIWQDDAAAETRQSESAQLAADARSVGEEKLALMIEAIAAARSQPSPEELPVFERAFQSPGDEPPPEFQLAHGVSLLRANQAQQFERAMWKVISDYPTLDQPYLLLIAYHTRSNAAGPALKVVSTWLANDPGAIGARLEQADALIAARQQPAGEALLLELLDESGFDPAVLARLQLFYARADRMPQFFEELQRRMQKEPQNGSLIEAIVGTRISQGQTPAAIRDLESAAAAAGDQPNLLYFIAGIFHQLGEKTRTEALMERALQIDPGHISSNNDLAYFYSEAGVQLTRAEAMARRAVAAEPENSAYLDTLGWVLYKQSRFAEAIVQLRQAVANASPIDPVLIDHLGDAEYRLGDVESATKQWRAAQELLSTMRTSREEHVRLRVELQNKLRQRAEGQAVEVAPVTSVDEK